tara:strand:+ start:1222 stop:1632 length:411 start_codon:yes stop_codon:yes gene_type:complete
MREKINKIVKDGNWEFARLLKLNEVCEELANKMYQDLSPAEILELIWEVKFDDGGNTLGHLISFHSKSRLKDEFITSFQKYFETATVSFKSPVEEPMVEESIKIEKPPLPKAKKKKSEEMVKNSDGTDMPKGVKRV